MAGAVHSGAIWAPAGHGIWEGVARLAHRVGMGGEGHEVVVVEAGAVQPDHGPLQVPG